MGHNEKRVYLEAIRKRYRKAGRRLKSKILDELCEVCHYNRKYAIRALTRLFHHVIDKTGKLSNNLQLGFDLP